MKKKKKKKQEVILNIYCVKNVFEVTFVKLYMTFHVRLLLIIESHYCYLCPDEEKSVRLF